MIDEEIISEVIFYSYNKKIISKEFLEKFVYKEVDKLDDVSKNTFKGFYIHDLGIFISSFDTYDGVLEFNSALLEYENCSISNYLNYNLFLLFLILHELEHLKEKYKLTLNNIESKLLKYSNLNYIYDKSFANNSKYKNTLISRGQFYKKYLETHDINPSERIADINAMESIIYSIEDYPGFLESYYYTYLKFYNNVINFYCTGYDIKNGKVQTPIFDYLTEMEQIDSLKSLSTYLEFGSNKNNKLNDILRKMKYGFPINKSELNKVKSLKIKR